VNERLAARILVKPRPFVSPIHPDVLIWEIDKWNRTDFAGFIVSCLVAGVEIRLRVGITPIGDCR
jgi:hypothetical protein